MLCSNESKVKVLENLASAIVKEKSRESLEQIVWDKVFQELLELEWGDVILFAQDYQVSI